MVGDAASPSLPLLLTGCCAGRAAGHPHGLVRHEVRRAGCGAAYVLPPCTVPGVRMASDHRGAGINAASRSIGSDPSASCHDHRTTYVCAAMLWATLARLAQNSCLMLCKSGLRRNRTTEHCTLCCVLFCWGVRSLHIVSCSLLGRRGLGVGLGVRTVLGPPLRAMQRTWGFRPSRSWGCGPGLDGVGLGGAWVRVRSLCAGSVGGVPACTPISHRTCALTPPPHPDLHPQ